MSEDFNQEENQEQQNFNNQAYSDFPRPHKPAEVKENDPGMKWVAFANVLGAIVIGLLLCSSLLMRAAERQAQQESQEQEINTPDEQKKASVSYRGYDYDLPVVAQNCENVHGDVDVVLITDANYMDFTRVAIESAKKNRCPLSKYNFYVMTMDVSAADEQALKVLADENVSVQVLPQQEADLFYIRDTHVSKTSLLKYYIPNAVPNLDKVLYIDSDILVLRDLNFIYQTNVDDVYLAAVKDPSWFFENTHVVELNLNERGFYFNSGVMLMNLKKIREDGLIGELEDFTNNNFRTYMDQDALNVVVGDKVKLLPYEANSMNFFFEHVDLPTLGEFYGRNWKNYDEAFGSSVIIHFASSKKPLGAPVSNDQFFRMLQRLWYKYYSPLPPLE